MPGTNTIPDSMPDALLDTPPLDHDGHVGTTLVWGIDVGVEYCDRFAERAQADNPGVDVAALRVSDNATFRRLRNEARTALWREAFGVVYGQDHSVLATTSGDTHAAGA